MLLIHETTVAHIEAECDLENVGVPDSMNSGEYVSFNIRNLHISFSTKTDLIIDVLNTNSQ